LEVLRKIKPRKINLRKIKNSKKVKNISRETQLGFAFYTQERIGTRNQSSQIVNYSPTKQSKKNHFLFLPRCISRTRIAPFDKRSYKLTLFRFSQYWFSHTPTCKNLKIISKNKTASIPGIPREDCTWDNSWTPQY